MNRVTIVTVCLNAYNDLKKTMESLLEQEDCIYEYIIKDGVSSDQTEKLVLKMKSQFEERGHDFKYICHEDNGIYDAMNQSLEIIDDDVLVLFLNAGDLLFSNRIVHDLQNIKIDKDAVAIYGLTKVKMKNMSLIMPAIISKNQYKVYHQSILVKSDVMKKIKFDTSYKIAADRDAMLKILHQGGKFQQLSMVISVYDAYGISSRNICECQNEVYVINKKYGIQTKNPKYLKNKIKQICFRYNPFLTDLKMIIHNIKE